MPFAVRPLINTSGKPVDPLGAPVNNPAVAKPAEAQPAISDEISFDELDTAPKPSAAKPEVKPEVKPETKPEVKPADKLADKAEEKPNPFEISEPKKRDYSELSPEDAELARKLPNKLHDLFRARLGAFKVEMDKKEQELAAAKSAAAKFTHDHPDAYKLDPAFNEALAEFEVIRSEQSFYEEQLVRAQNGEDWAYIKEFDKDGNPVLEKVAANGRVNSEHVRTLRQAVNSLAQREQAAQMKAAQIKNTYVTSAKEVQQHFQQAKAKLFPGIDPGKLEGQEKAIYDLVFETLPVAARQHPSAQMQALAAVVVLRANRALQAALERAERAERIAGTAATADPIKPSLQPAVVAAPGEVISFDELDRPGR